MFGIGMPEMLLLLAVALIIFGPKKLPELAKSIGRALGEFKRATSEIKDNIEEQTGLGEVRDSLNNVQKDIKAQVDLGMADTDEAAPEKPAPSDPAPLSQVKDAFDALNSGQREEAIPTATSQTEADDPAPPEPDPRKNSTS